MIPAPLALALPLAFALRAAPALQPVPELDLEQHTAVRCAVAFALTAEAQARGAPEATSLPPLAQRGREYFVRVSARLMDDLALDQQQVADLLGAQARTLAQQGDAPAVARACLPFLDAAGL